MPDTILVTGVIDLDPAKRDDAIELFLRCQAATREEAGNEAYAFTADLADPGRFHVAERWASKEAMDLHMATPHLAELMGSMGAMGVTAVSITQWVGATGTKVM